MKTFEFAALDSSGKKRVGTVRAGGLSEAKIKLQEKGFYLTYIEVQEGSDSYRQNHPSFFREIKELFFFAGVYPERRRRTQDRLD